MGVGGVIMKGGGDGNTWDVCEALERERKKSGGGGRKEMESAEQRIDFRRLREGFRFGVAGNMRKK